MVVGPGLKTGMPIRYDNPHEVGADRIVNGVAAFAAFGGPVIVVDFGTATTIDVVDADGAYLGGAIAPGVETSAEALFTKAARLSKVDLEAAERGDRHEHAHERAGGTAAWRGRDGRRPRAPGVGRARVSRRPSWRPAAWPSACRPCARRSPTSIWT